MKVKELIKRLKEFQKKLIKHQTLYSHGNSFPKFSGGMHPVRNIDELQEQSRLLNRWWGENQAILNQFRNKMTVQSPSTGDEWDYTDSAIGLDEIAPIKTQSLKKLIAEIDRIIGRLTGMNPNIELNNDLHISKNEIKPSIKESKFKEVFIVHGHNEDKKNTVARYIEQLGLKTIILHEQPNKGRTIIEKFEDYSDVSFAIVLLTADDLGCDKKSSKSNALEHRARQNVIFEFGFFFGKLGRKKVCALHEEGVDVPSDVKGIIYISFKDNWKFSVARELKSSGINIKADNILNC